MTEDNEKFISDSSQFIIEKKDLTKLYTHSKQKISENYFKLTGTKNINLPDESWDYANESKETLRSETYQVYEPVFSLNDKLANQNPNDCGRYANAVVNDDPEGWKSQTLSPNLGTGMKSTGEIDMSMENGGKERQSALPGEMYLIHTDIDQKDSKFKHHAAPVIAKDGADHITSEAHSGKDITKPEFTMYGPKENSFYERHHDQYDVKDGPKAYMQISAPKTE